MSRILVTGGAGYIGSHVCKALKKAGYVPVTFDDFSQGHKWAIRWGPFFHGNIHNQEEIGKALLKYLPEGIIHLAGTINLRDSILDPYKYYFNHLQGTLSLLKTMVQHQVRFFIFSSSAAIYSSPQNLPVDESHPKFPSNPYGKAKWMTEQLLEDFYCAHGISSVILRFFNVAGADLEGEIGEAHNPETHLIPKLILSTQQKGKEFTIFNTHLPTFDGTAVRDYIHVCDIANAHVLALRWLEKNQGTRAFNLGSGKGHSVYQIIDAIQEISGYAISICKKNEEISELPVVIANPSRARNELGWETSFSSMSQILRSAWTWHSSRCFTEQICNIL